MEYHIKLHLRTCKGLESFGKFYIGNDKEFAQNLFQKLQGKRDIDDQTILYFDLLETKGGLPYNIQVIGCTLEQLAENCTIITKETFKHLNLEEIK